VRQNFFDRRPVGWIGNAGFIPSRRQIAEHESVRLRQRKIAERADAVDPAGLFPIWSHENLNGRRQGGKLKV
jgi:endonuclease I